MPIAPAAKGIIIVSGILVAASIALYENEQVREWIENTGRKISGAWDDIVNFDQRQRQRRTQPQGYAMGGAQEMGRSVQERRDARRRLYETAGERQGSVVPGREATAATSGKNSVDDEGLRKRKARGEESQEHLLGQAQRHQELEKTNELLFDQAEDPAISVPDLQPEVAGQATTDAGTATGSRSLQSSPFFSIKGSQEDVSASAQTLLDYEMPASLVQARSPNHDAISSMTRHEPPNQETPNSLPQSASFTFPEESTQHTLQSPLNTSSIPATTTAAAEPLTLTIPTTPRSHALSTPTLSPDQVHTPTSAASSSFSSPTSYGAGIHTPSHLDDEEFDAISDAGTETASQVSEWREELRENGRDDDLMSVASEESGWSEVGAEEQRERR